MEPRIQTGTRNYDNNIQIQFIKIITLKRKTINEHAQTEPGFWGYQMLWLATNESSKVVSPTQLKHSNTRRSHCYSVPLQAGSTSGSSDVGRNMSMKIPTNVIGNQTRDLSACSAVHQQTVSLKRFINPRVLLSVWWIISCSPSFLELWQVLLSISVFQKVADKEQKQEQADHRILDS